MEWFSWTRRLSLPLGVLGTAGPYGYDYGDPGYAYGCVQTQWDPGVGYVRVRAPC